MTATRPAPTDAQVEALARVLYEEDKSLEYDFVPWVDATEAEHTYWRDLARAALASSVIGDLIAEAGARVLTETADAWQHGQWADAPRCADRVQERIANGQHVTDWLRTRAAALSPTPAEVRHASYYSTPGGHPGTREQCRVCPPTPADGTTSERSEA